MFNDFKDEDTPSANYYSPSYNLVSPSRGVQRSIGYGDRYDFTRSANANPGPGAYKITSAFDKYKPKHQPLYRPKRKI